jgi:hypothetical protein
MPYSALHFTEMGSPELADAKKAVKYKEPTVVGHVVTRVPGISNVENKFAKYQRQNSNKFKTQQKIMASKSVKKSFPRGEQIIAEARPTQ